MSRIDAYKNAVGSSQDIVTQYAPLVKRIAHHLMSRLPSSVQVEDMMQAGMIGLLEASRNFDSTKGASFETFAGIRIRGAMIDEIRRGDWVPRSVHRNTRLIAEKIAEIEQKTGRDARDTEVAAALGVELDTYRTMLLESSTGHMLDFNDLGVDEDYFSGNLSSDGSENNPYEGLQSADFKKCLASAIGGLPERERMVLALYYDEELNLKEIGEVIGVSESRISQINSQAMIRLQSRLRDWRK